MNILNLPSWAVLETREADHDYHITVQLTYPPSHCPHCGVVANLQGYGGKEQLFLDLPIQMKRVAILVQRRRFKCKECKRTFLELLPDIEVWCFSCLINTLIRIALVSNAKTEYGDGVRQADEPMLSVTTQMAGRARTYIVGGGNTQLGQIDSHARTEADPMFTVSASDGARKVAAAYLLDGDNGRPGTGEPTYRTADQPAATLRASRTTLHRAYTAGRWVRMTIQALGRFQTVPDDYRGLTAEINGNGVPCEEARQIMLSVKG